MVKLAYIITSYQDPNQLKELVDALGGQDIFIHIDLKSNIDDFKSIINKDNVKFISNRKLVSWGGYSQVESLKELLIEVKESNKNYDRVVCLSGTDYVSYPISKIEEDFINNPNKEYINAIDITGDNKHNNKVIQYWNFDIQNVFVRRIMNQLWYRFTKYLGNKKKDYLMIDNKKWDVYFGSDYFSLTYDCAMYVLDCLSNKQIINYFKSSYVPSELVFPTIVFNSKYGKNANLLDNSKEYRIRYEKLCALHYEIYEPLIKVMTINDITDIKQSGKLFFRKAKTGESDSLIEYIKNEK